MMTSDTRICVYGCMGGGVGAALVLANWLKSVRRHSRSLCALPVATLPSFPQYALSLSGHLMLPFYHIPDICKFWYTATI